MLLSSAVLAYAGSDSKIISSKDALASYLQLPEDHLPTPQLLQHHYDVDRKLFIDTYSFASQTWPKPEMGSHGTVWQHSLVMYVPDKVSSSQALLFVNGGTRNVVDALENPAPHEVDFGRIAQVTQTIVIDLQDVPNQYLVFSDNIPRKEDGIIAYSWKQFLQQPSAGYYWPAHLPMTKAVIKAMDLAQQLAQDSYHVQVNHFVVAGASKRGLATWLAALSDERINAIVPIVIDILNTKDNLQHIYSSYNQHWPQAFKDYLVEGIPDWFNKAEFVELMNIEDPISYLTGVRADVYQKRLSIPKLIISAAGDDFFVPGSVSLYLDRLSGETLLRALPNQSHYVDMRVVEEALLPFYLSMVNATVRPALQWEVDARGLLQGITTNQQPAHVVLWEAENSDARDFRLAANVRYHPQVLSGQCGSDGWHYTATIKRPPKGWKASFIEVTYQRRNGAVLVLTTPITITSVSMS